MRYLLAYLLFLSISVNLAQSSSDAKLNIFFRKWLYDTVIHLGKDGNSTYSGYVIDASYDHSMEKPVTTSSIWTHDNTTRFVYNYFGDVVDPIVKQWCDNNTDKDYIDSFDIRHDINVIVNLHCLKEGPRKGNETMKNVDKAELSYLVKSDFEDIFHSILKLWSTGIGFEMDTCNIIIIHDDNVTDGKDELQFEYDYKNKTVHYYIRSSLQSNNFGRWCSRYNTTYIDQVLIDDVYIQNYRRINGNYHVHHTVLCNDIPTITVTKTNETKKAKLEATCDQEIHPVLLLGILIITYVGTFVIMTLIDKYSTKEKDQQKDDIGMLVINNELFDENLHT